MKITNVSFEQLNFDLAEPYEIAYETISKATNFILKIETDLTLVGYGCAAPDFAVTGETNSEVDTAIKTIVIPHLQGKNPFKYALLLAEIKLQLANKPSVLAMVDMALNDLIARKADVPLYQLLGGYRNSISTSVTIGILPIMETLAQAKAFVDQGFRILKIKGGKDVEGDIEKMVTLRENFPQLTFRFDGNQGYSVDQSVYFFKATEKVGIEIFEQPTVVGEEEHMGIVTRDTRIPVMADESLKTLKDVFRLTKNERINMINIKLMKVGGIMEAMHINSVAKSANVEAMVGCMDECALGISAGLHFALSRPNIRYADLDGHLDFLEDPFKNLFQIKNGVLYPSDSPGLGDIKF